MKYIENDSIELKSIITSKICKEVIAFANTNGGTIYIGVDDDRLEFVSIGGLLEGITLEDVSLGLSICRNPKLANIFYRLQLIEAYGTGLPKILNSYKDTSLRPKIEVTNNAFKITLPNINYAKDQANYTNSELISDEQKIVEYITNNEYITRSMVEQLQKKSSKRKSNLKRIN